MKRILILIISVLLFEYSYCNNTNLIDTLTVDVYNSNYNVSDSTMTLTTSIAELYFYNDIAMLYINDDYHLVLIDVYGIEPEISAVSFKIYFDIINNDLEKNLYITCYNEYNSNVIDRVIHLNFK